MRGSLADFIKWDLKPSMYQNLSRLFPEMEFRQGRNGWESRLGIGGREPMHSFWGKSVVTAKVPDRILEQGGDSIEIIEYYQQQNRLSSPIEAIQAIAQQLGLELPQMEDSASYIAYREKQDSLSKLLDKMRRDLFSPAGADTLAYAKSRGWSEEIIEQMGVGYCSSETAAELRNILGRGATTLQRSVGVAYTLSIPFISRGEILGVVFRNITGEGAKYTEAFVSERATKLYNLYGLSGVPLTGKGEHDKEIVVVEGEIDALRASAAGVQNVVAAAGKNLSAEALQRAKEMGVERIVFLLDYDGEDKVEERRKDIAKALRTIREAGLTGLVAAFPADGEKVDTDTYLSTHTGEDLQGLVYGAELGIDYQLRSLFEKYSSIDTLSGIEEDNFRREVTSLAFEGGLAKWEQIRLFTIAATASGGRFTEGYFMEELLKIEEAQKAVEQRSATAALIQKAGELLQEGRTAEALQEMEKASTVRNIAKEAAFSKYLQAPTEEGILAGLRKKKAGIPTGYYFQNQKGEQIEMEIPTGALTFICAPTSHGKSRFLQNLALNLATGNREGAVLYISLEEDTEQIVERFINLHTNTALNRGAKNNSQMIREYFGEGSSRWINSEKLPILKERSEELFTLLKSGRLRIFSRTDSAELGYIEELQGMVEYLSKNISIQAIFIDYVQEIYSHKRSSSRKDELMEICNRLMSLSVSSGLPIVLASQLNREALSPLDMSVQNISDASNIEHAANTILLLWDSVVLPTAGKDNSYYFYNRTGTGENAIKEKKTTEEAKALEERGFTMGSTGTLYALLAKNRSGERNMDTVLHYCGNTGKIESNTPPAEAAEKAEQAAREKKERELSQMGIDFQ